MALFFISGKELLGFFSSISAKVQLTVTTTLAAICAGMAVITQNLGFLVVIGLLHSSMWSCIYSLSIKVLGKYTSRALGAFVSAVFGGDLTLL